MTLPNLKDSDRFYLAMVAGMMFQVKGEHCSSAKDPPSLLLCFLSSYLSGLSFSTIVSDAFHEWSLLKHFQTFLMKPLSIESFRDAAKFIPFEYVFLVIFVKKQLPQEFHRVGYGPETENTHLCYGQLRAHLTYAFHIRVCFASLQ